MNTPITTLTTYVGSIWNLELRKICLELLDCPLFAKWPAAIGHHHNYPGGLAAHTLEVMNYAMKASITSADRGDVLIAACLWHDCAKIREYEVVSFAGDHEAPEGALHWRNDGAVTEYWEKSDYLKKIGHVTGSAMEFHHMATLNDVPLELVDAVCHCILAHHGRVEWGSPVEPQTVEAMLLHHADMLSAKFGPTREAP